MKTWIDLTDTAVLPVNNKEKEQVNSTNNNNKSGSTNICANKTNCNKNEQYRDITRCLYDHDSTKYGNTIRMDDNCLYRQRSKTTAVLISIYFGVFGVDWFYLSRGNSGYIMIGICKLLISCGCCSGWPLLTLSTRRISGLMIMIGYILNILFSLTALAWWVVDWARILANKFPDGNGVELKHFSEYF
jgi:uncharacterized membrane protein